MKYLPFVGKKSRQTSEPGAFVHFYEPPMPSESVRTLVPWEKVHPGAALILNRKLHKAKN